jgi:hypothetical protein
MSRSRTPVRSLPALDVATSADGGRSGWLPWQATRQAEAKAAAETHAAAVDDVPAEPATNKETGR